MPKHADFEKIYGRFTKQYGAEEGKKRYFKFIKAKGHDDTKPLPGKKKENKEFQCSVIGLEVKETADAFHIEGLIATTHVDNLDMKEGIEIPDKIEKETLEDFSNQGNSNKASRIMGVHHSEGRSINAEFFGEADTANTPMEVIPLNDGEWGLFVDTKLLKNDPGAVEVAKQFQSGELNSFSITYNTEGFLTTDFDWVGDDLVRVLKPGTQLCGYTAASNPVNPNAIATGYGFKEFKELVGKFKKEVVPMKNNKETKEETPSEEPKPSEEKKKVEEAPKETGESKPSEEKPKEASPEEANADEKKEFAEFKASKKALEQKELVEKTATKVVEGIMEKVEVKEKVLKDGKAPAKGEAIPLEVKEFNEGIVNPTKVGNSEQFRRAAAVSEKKEIAWDSTTVRVEEREFKNFGTNGKHLEFKGLGVTTNQNTDTDYLQSGAELQDVYDPVIYNALNQGTLTWNLLAKDDFSKKGNNQVQFVLKTAANASAAFYTGNAVVTDNVGRLKYMTKFKKLQVGVSVDGDMIAAARGGPVSDVFAQEVLDSTMDMLAVLNAAIFAEVGLETAAGPIGFEYISDSAGNTTMYSLTRSTTNLLSPASAGDTYINQSSTIISMTNLRKAIKQAVTEGANKSNLVWITNMTQGNLLRGKFDDSRRMLSSKDTDFWFSTDLFVDGVPVFEDKDCNTDDWWLIDLETHRVAIWVPPTIERLGKSADSEDAFIKMYLAIYNRAPRRLVQIYGAATS
jgi:hypothetical protein